MTIDLQHSTWRGQRVRLRAIEPGDWEAYFAWNQDDEQARALHEVPLPRSREAVRRWAESEALKQPDGHNARFVIENMAGEVVGDLTTHRCNARVGAFSYGVAIHRQHRRQGYASEAIELVLRYFFDELRYQKVTVTIRNFNEDSIRLHQRLGFQQEGRLRRTVYTRGEWFDELLYGLTVEEWRARGNGVH